MTDKIEIPDYQQWLQEIKSRITDARVRLAVAANRELIRFYYELGAVISAKQDQAKWGDKVIGRLSSDLKREFPDMKGLSASNLKYCKRFYQFYSNGQQRVDQNAADAIGQHAVDQIPWGHNIQIFTKCHNLEEASFYVAKTLESGWSRDVLAMQLKSGLFARQGQAITNFVHTLPPPQSDLAQQTIKDPYTFDFLAMAEPYSERDVEKQLVTNITKFLLELGKGFAFIGQQYHLEIENTDYYIDLLFYHTVLKCHVVVELKNKRFIPEYAGKLNFYLSAVDSLVKSDDDNPTIGLLLCRDKNNVEVEFSLRDMQKPMGVSEYTVTETLPADLRGALPTPQEIEEVIKREQNLSLRGPSYFRPEIENMKGYTPGEQPAGLSRIIKLNTNENPYPPSPAVKQALNDLPFERLCRYPDPMSVGVRKAAGALFGLTEDWVIAGNGSDDLLTILVRCFSDAECKVACMNPGYSLYPILTDIQGAEMVVVELTDGFELPLNVLDQIEDCNLFFLTRPNAPTGIATPMAAVRAICETFDGIVVIDEAYADFADDHCVGLAKEYDNVVVTRTVSKSYSLANVRFGVAFAQPPLIEGMMKVKDSYNVNGITQTIAQAAFSDQNHLSETVEKVRKTRERVSAQLIDMGFELTSSQTNFLFAKPPCNAAEFFAKLKAKGILLRYFSDPRCADYVRITIGTDEEMDAFLAETKTTLSQLK